MTEDEARTIRAELGATLSVRQRKGSAYVYVSRHKPRAAAEAAGREASSSNGQQFDRYIGPLAQLPQIEANPRELRLTIAAVLADAPRPGAPDTFSAEQIVAIVNLACTSPADAGRPIDAWTPRELADEAVKRAIVSRISPQSVAHFLKSGRVATASQPLLAERQRESY